jgi:ubiquinone/menaquinone biosynthesis C-methylase UbiE/uncharacterized protein YbaR (Trm112 family)
VRRRLLDILACPNDGQFPLRLRIDASSPAPAVIPACDTYCELGGAGLGQTPAADCADCRQTEIESGELSCPACGAVFEIISGIPRMVAALDNEDDAGRDKNREMVVRDEQAERYDSMKMLKLLSKLELPKTLRSVAAGPGDLVVELGSGTGRITLPVADLAAEVVAADFSTASLERARAGHRRRGNVHWIQADISRLPLRSGVADRVLSSQVFEHLPGREVREGAVDEAARILKAGGTFVISVYRDSWFWRLLGPKEGYHPGGIYYCRLTNQEFKDLLSRRFTISEMTRNLGLYLQLANCSKKT